MFVTLASKLKYCYCSDTRAGLIIRILIVNSVLYSCCHVYSVSLNKLIIIITIVVLIYVERELSYLEVLFNVLISM